MSKAAEKQIVKYDIPAPAKVGQIAGLEGFDSEMLIIPRIKMVQMLSVEVTDGIKPGSLVDSVTKEVLAEPGESLLVVPLMVGRSRIFFRPIKEGGGIACRAIDGRNGIGEPGGLCAVCPKKEWTQNEKGENQPPECTEFLNVAVMPLRDGQSIPLIVSFGKTSFMTGKQFINTIYMRQDNPWKFAYELSTKMIEDNKGIYAVMQFKPAGKAPQELVDVMEGYYTMLKNTEHQVHIDEDEVRAEQQNIAKQEHEDDEPVPPTADETPF